MMMRTGPRCYLRAFLMLLLGHLCHSCEHHNHHLSERIEQHSSRHSNDQKVSLLSQRRDKVEEDETAAYLQPEMESCGFEEPTAAQLAADQAIMRLWQFQRAGNDVPVNYTIPTYFHLLQYNSSDLLLSDSNVRTYMTYLNTAFDASNSPFNFPLMGITRTINATWSTNCRNSTYQIAYRTLLRRGRKETLNVYVCNPLPPGPNGGSTTGFATLPSKDFSVTDGVTIIRSTPTDTQRQNTLVHEVGHFLGLLHTFQDNCNTTKNGDQVDDTPYHISLASTVNCKTSPSTWDTCPTLLGLDPVDNYMTYTTDNHGCRTRFTQGQVSRMIAQFEMYRYSPPLLPPTKAPTKESISRPTVPVSAPFPITVPIPITSPTTEGTCQTFFSLCNSNSDCCSADCQPFLGVLFFRKRCRLFFVYV